MSSDVSTIWEQIRRLPPESVDQLLGAFFDDPELREDLLDYVAVLKAREEGEAPIELEEFILKEDLE